MKLYFLHSMPFKPLNLLYSLSHCPELLLLFNHAFFHISASSLFLSHTVQQLLNLCSLDKFPKDPLHSLISSSPVNFSTPIFSLSTAAVHSRLNQLFKQSYPIPLLHHSTTTVTNDFQGSTMLSRRLDLLDSESAPNPTKHPDSCRLLLI